MDITKTVLAGTLRAELNLKLRPAGIKILRN